ncbi:MAG TPA: hypothetical protein VK904_01160 [Miltoncostaeaceae bacterium]|nr:hypothetical protein [Miltoncostaeaceae bacterium]
MTTLFLLIVAVTGLVIVGFFLPLLWIVAGVLVVLGILYIVRMGRDAAEGDGAR